MSSQSPFSDLPPTPLLSQQYSGIPKRLAPEAKKAKKLIYGNKSSDWSSSRSKEVPLLPPDVTREAFNTAIADLKSLIGDQHVEINDKPLNDGWYMEHPFVYLIINPFPTGCSPRIQQHP
jgi:hypothetical protein